MEVLVQRSAVNLSDFRRRCKKTRRGQKKRRTQSPDVNVAIDPPDPSSASSTWTSDANPDPLTSRMVGVSTACPLPVTDVSTSAVDDDVTIESRPEHRLLLRPLLVPMAPNNSTQFIIDDHEDCHLYQSFESPAANNGEDVDDDVESASAGRGRKRRRRIGEFSSPSPCYWDIDYEYESPDDPGLTMAAFIERDFETIYRRAREEELSALGRPELVSRLLELEQLATCLEEREVNVVVAIGAQMCAAIVSSDGLAELETPKLKEDDPISVCQDELLRLQEENETLRSVNSSLKIDETSKP